jgi:hypothetical protein
MSSSLSIISYILLLIFISISNSFLPQDSNVDDVSHPFETLLLQTLDSLWLMSELSAIPRLAYSSSDHPISLTLLKGVPAHHYLDLDDPRLGLGPKLERGFCLGGNRYSYDGFFVGRCRSGCGRVCDEHGIDEPKAEAELWNFEFEAPSLGELSTG